MNTFCYIHTITVYQFWSRWRRDDKYIPQLYINFPAHERVMICTYRNFISTFQQMSTWWYIHTATLYQLSCRWTRDDIYIPKLYINFPADENVMIYTYRSFISTFLQLNTWWYIFMWELYINFPADEHVMIYTFRNFISTFLQMNTWWYIYVTTLYQLSCGWTRDNIYIPQLYINFPADEHVMIYTYRNFISTLLQMNTWWYIHTATLYQLSCRWRPGDIYLPKLYINLPADEHVMIYTYRNFISTFLQMNTWWYRCTETLSQFSSR